MVTLKKPVTATTGATWYESSIEGISGCFDGVLTMEIATGSLCGEEVPNGATWHTYLQDNDMVEQSSCDLFLKPESYGKGWASLEMPMLRTLAYDTDSVSPLRTPLFESIDNAGTSCRKLTLNEIKEFSLCVEPPLVLSETGLQYWNHDRTMTERVSLTDGHEIGLSSISTFNCYEATLGRSLRCENRRPALNRLETINPSLASRIRHLGALEPGWDGYNGLPISDKAKENTAVLLIIAAFLGESLDDPFIAPLPDGGLEIEWEIDSGPELLVDVPATAKPAEFLLEVPRDVGEGYDSTEGSVTLTSNRFKRLIARLMDYK